MAEYFAEGTHCAQFSSPLAAGVKSERPPYKNTEHALRTLRSLDSMRTSRQLCDVILAAGNVQMAAHRNILAASSPYFFAMFTAFSEKSQERIFLQELEGEALRLLIDYIYTSEVKVTEDNVQILLQGANHLQLTDVRDACCDFLQSQLHPSNCLGIRSFADLHACVDLVAYADNYIELHFTEVTNNEEFLALTADQLSALISNDRISVASEEQVFEAVMQWVRHDQEDRHLYLARLMEHVRLPLLPKDYLIQQVESEPLLMTDHVCKDFLIEAMKYHLVKDEHRKHYETPRTKPRTPIGRPKCLLVVGGQAPKAIRNVEAYDFKRECWFTLSELPSRRCRAGVALFNGCIYAVGGFNGALRVRTVDVYNPLRDCWSQVASMEARRSTLGVAVLGDYLYAVGGFDGSIGLSSAERYDPRTDRWHPIASMSVRRSSVGVGVLDGLLYALGGYDGASRQCLSSVECYDPEKNVWTSVSDMTCRRSGAGVGVLNGILIAVGGHDGPQVRRSVECYNPIKRCWSPMPDMIMSRRNAGVVTLDDKLFVVGGDDGASNLASVEMYDSETRTWVMLPAYMSLGRSYAGVTLIDKPKDASSSSPSASTAAGSSSNTTGVASTKAESDSVS